MSSQSNDPLVQQLQGYKQSGLSPDQAADAFFGRPSAQPSPLNPAELCLEQVAGSVTAAAAVTVAPTDFAVAFAQVYTISAAEMATILHRQYPDASATSVGQAVKDALPATDSATMFAALTTAGFSDTDAQCAVNVLYPLTVQVQANQSWQLTGLNVLGLQTTTLTVTGGQWTANPATGMCGGNGNAHYVAKAGYALPGAHEGALVGRIGNNPAFLVGAGAVAPQGQAGVLSLCINDDLNHLYGSGLSDNIGSLTVNLVTS